MAQRFLLLILLLTGLAQAAPVREARTEQVEATLLAEADTVQPGSSLRVALRLRMIPHWHTYWKNPGDSGQATSIEWTGAEAGEIEWATPSRQALGPITNYGYEGEVLLLVKLKVPADLKPGSRFQPTAAATWLVCKDICIPQDATLGLDLPVAAAAVASADAPALRAAEQALPGKAPWAVSVGKLGTAMQLSWPASGAAEPQAWFFADAWGVVAHSAPQPLTREGDQWRLQLPAGEQPLAAGKALTGVLVVDGKAYALEVPVSTAAAVKPPQDESQNLGLAAAIALALAGGVILNLMPCVFPVLSIKALSLLSHSGPEARRHGLAYTGGVLASFAALAAVLLALRAAGGEVGWGFQFQSPLFVLGVAYLLFAVGLSLSGLFEIGASAAGIGSGLAEKPGLAGSFFTGVLATVVATPCTAPFMGAALAYALAQPAIETLAVFLSLGLGLALPYLLLSFWPALQRVLPRPGAWMDTLKQALAFPMYAAALWLVWVLAQQTGPDGVALALGGLLLMALAAWLRRALRTPWPALAVLVGALATPAWLPSSQAVTSESKGDSRHFEPYSPERLAELRAAGQPVFVNLTAAWCISCLVNERVALSRPEVKAAFEAGGITYLKGDWTNRDARISALLAEYGRTGVPLYLYFPKGAEGPAHVLPQLLTPAIVIAALNATPKERLP